VSFKGIGRDLIHEGLCVRNRKDPRPDQKKTIRGMQDRYFHIPMHLIIDPGGDHEADDADRAGSTDFLNRLGLH
jgi:hypothetical protein